LRLAEIQVEIRRPEWAESDPCRIGVKSEASTWANSGPTRRDKLLIAEFADIALVDSLSLTSTQTELLSCALSDGLLDNAKVAGAN
jgi:hypothetical protein